MTWQKNHGSRWLLILAAVLVIGGMILVIAGCGASTISKTANPVHAKAATPAAAPQAIAATGPVGTTYTDTATQDSGGTAAMEVTLASITDPAQGADEFTTPDAGTRFIALNFTIVGVSGVFSDDVNNDVTVIGSNDQTYSPGFNSLAGCTDFNSGIYTTQIGQTLKGCAEVQVPDGVQVKEVQWATDPYSSNPPATWTR